MELHKDELELISEKLTFDPDYIRFRSICKPWRSAAPKRPQLPWLISYYPTNRNFIFASFYQFSFETNQITRVSEILDSSLLPSFIDKSTVCFGSSRGWLALLKMRTLSVLLFNPLTNSSIDLPNWSKEVCFYSESKFYLTSDPHESLSDCFAVIYKYGISYCKVGSNAWIELVPRMLIRHFCPYHGKHLFASDSRVFVCDFGPNSSVCEIISVSLDDDKEFEFSCSYLVESGEDLLFVLVFREAGFNRLCFFNRSCYFRVFKLEVECHLPKPVELKNLGNKALFLSRKSAFALTSSKYPGCKESCIYTAIIFHKKRNPIQMEVDNFGGPMGRVCAEYDVAPSGFSYYECDWFSPSLLM